MDTSADTRVDDRPTCPDCGSSNTTFKKKASEWECQDCEHRFPTPHAAGMGRIDLSQKTGDPKRIFFSYGHDGNRELVDRFKGDLEKRGHEVWIDYKEIGTWDDWRGQITAGIAQSQLAIAFLSKHATRDPGVCRNEVAMALDRFFTVYPILMEPLDQVSPPVTISHIQWQDLSRWRAILAGTVPDINWDRWYEARLIEIVDLVESQAGHFGGEIQVLENVLRPLSFTSEITRHIPSFTGRQWVFEAYKDWLENQPQSRLFWIQGGPGIGKTALAAVLTNNYPSAIVSAWFCRSDSIERRDPRRALQTIALQLAARLPDYRTRLLQALALTATAPDSAQGAARENLAKLTPADLFHRLLKQPLAGLIPRDHKLVVVIDALDEATDSEGNNPLTDLLVTDLAALPDWLSFVVTSRPDPAIVHRLARFKPFPLDAADARNRADLEHYIAQALLARPALCAAGPESAKALTETLLARSEGMMLYLRLIFEAYDAGVLDREGVSQTPQGLGALYAAQFRQRFPQAVYDQEVKPLLRLLLAALGPLPEGLAREVLAQDLETWQRHRDKLASFLIRKDNGLLLFHKTLTEWLLSEAAGDYRVDPATARKHLAEVLWADYETHQESPLEMVWTDPVGQWLPHWLDVLFADQGPEKLATQMNDFACFLQEKRALYREAEPLYRQALAIRQKVLGPEHSDTAMSLNNLASLLQDQGHLAEAEPLLRQALAINQKVLGPEDLDTATSLNNLAMVLKAQGRLAEAEPLYRQALAISQKALGPEHPTTATSLNNLASLLQAQGHLPEAEPLYRQALAIREKVLGPEHPDTAMSLNNLASLLQDQGHLAEAEPLYRQALAINQKVLGPEHPTTAASLNNLASLLQDQGHLAEAEPLLRQALAIYQKALGPEHPDTANSLNNLAMVLEAQGRLAEAEPLYRQALAIYQKTLRPEHLTTANSLNNLGTLLQAQGRLAEAEPLLRQALAITQKALGSGHPTTATSLNNLASLLQDQGHFAEAEPLYRQALAICQKALGPEHPTTAANLNNLATLLQAQGHLDEAEPLLREALAIRQKVLGPEHPATATGLANLASLLQDQGQLAEAEPLYRQALAIDQKALGLEHPTTAISLENLAMLLKAQGQLAEAEPLLREALAIRQKALGLEHPDTIVNLNKLAALLKTQNKLDEAEPLYRQALAIRQKALGLEHLDTAISLANLASLLQDQGQLAEAEPLYRQALAIYQKVLGPEHATTATSLNNLARLLQAQGHLDEAEPMYQKALVIRQTVLGPQHRDTIASQYNLASVLNKQNRFKEAEPLMRTVIRHLHQERGENSPATQQVIREWRAILSQLGLDDATVKERFQTLIASC